MTEAATNLKTFVPPAELQRAPIVENNRGPGWLTDKLSSFAEGKTPLWWWIFFVPAVLGAAVLLPAMLIYQVSTGVGVWGNNQPVAWGWDIINFVWWVGVAQFELKPAGCPVESHELGCGRHRWGPRRRSCAGWRARGARPASRSIAGAVGVSRSDPNEDRGDQRGWHDHRRRASSRAPRHFVQI